MAAIGDSVCSAHYIKRCIHCMLIILKHCRDTLALERQIITRWVAKNNGSQKNEQITWYCVYGVRICFPLKCSTFAVHIWTALKAFNFSE
jgi:hypothetical protein